MKREETLHWLEQIIPAPLEFGEQVGIATLADAQTLAVTTTFADVDTGLQRLDEANPDTPGEDVRCELLTVGRTGPGEVTAAVQAAAAKLERTGGLLPAQPGIMLPSILDRPQLQVHHGLLIAPYLWGGQTPQVAEPDRLTLICQLLMLTDAEYAYAVEEGVGKLQQAIAEEGIDLLDWSRTG